MGIIFYNIASITVGLILIYLGIICIIKKDKKPFGITTLVNSVFFIGFGIFGFFLYGDLEVYSFIVILAMLAFSIFEILLFLLLYKKEDTVNKKIWD